MFTTSLEDLYTDNRVISADTDDPDTPCHSGTGGDSIVNEKDQSQNGTLMGVCIKTEGNKPKPSNMAEMIDKCCVVFNDNCLPEV